MATLRLCLDLRSPDASRLLVWGEGGEHHISRDASGLRTTVFAEVGVRIWTLAVPDPLPESEGALEAWYRDHPSALLTGHEVGSDGRTRRLPSDAEPPRAALESWQVRRVRQVLHVQGGRAPFATGGGDEGGASPEKTVSSPSTSSSLLERLGVSEGEVEWSVGLTKSHDGSSRLIWGDEALEERESPGLVLVGGSSLSPRVQRVGADGQPQGAPTAEELGAFREALAASGERGRTIASQLPVTPSEQASGEPSTHREEGARESSSPEAPPARFVDGQGESWIRVFESRNPDLRLEGSELPHPGRKAARFHGTDYTDPTTGEVVSALYLPPGRDVVLEADGESVALRLHGEGGPPSPLPSNQAAQVRLDGVPLSPPRTPASPAPSPDPPAPLPVNETPTSHASALGSPPPMDPPSLESAPAPPESGPPEPGQEGGEPREFWSDGTPIPSMDALPADLDEEEGEWSEDLAPWDRGAPHAFGPEDESGGMSEPRGEPSPPPDMDADPGGAGGEEKEEALRLRPPTEGTIHVSNWRNYSPRGELWASELLNTVASDEELERLGCLAPIQLLRKGYSLSRSDRTRIDAAMTHLSERIDEVRVANVRGATYFARLDAEGALDIIGPKGNSPRDDEVAQAIARALGVSVSSLRDSSRRDRSYSGRGGR